MGSSALLGISSPFSKVTVLNHQQRKNDSKTIQLHERILSPSETKTSDRTTALQGEEAKGG